MGSWTRDESPRHNWVPPVGRFAIYNSNPLEGKGHLGNQRPIMGAEFTCTATGETLNGNGGVANYHCCLTENQFKNEPGMRGHVHFDAAFFVGGR